MSWKDFGKKLVAPVLAGVVPLTLAAVSLTVAQDAHWFEAVDGLVASVMAVLVSLKVYFVALAKVESLLVAKTTAGKGKEEVSCSWSEASKLV